MSIGSYLCFPFPASVFLYFLCPLRNTHQAPIYLLLPVAIDGHWGTKMLLRPSFSPFSRRGAIPVRVNEGNHHEILWNSEVIRLEHWSWRNQTGSRRQRPPLRK